MNIFKAKNLLWEKAFWSITLGAMFFITYGYANHYTSTLSDVPAIFFSWEKHIPFIEWMIIPYMSSDVLFVWGLLICATRVSLRNLAKRYVFVNLVAIVCYFLFPLVFTFQKPEIQNSFFNIFFEMLKLDKPYNQNPSLHIAYGFVIWLVFIRTYKGIKLYFSHFWFFLIALSTLTVYQHHFIDLIGGFILGAYAIVILPLRENQKFESNNLSILLHSASLATLILAWYLNDNFLGLIFLYLSLSTLVMGLAYNYRWYNILAKKNGKTPLLRHIFFLPYILGCKLNWKKHAKTDAQISSLLSHNITIGRRPLNHEVDKLNLAKETIIIDLCPEICENQELKKNHDYYHLPILDLSTPTKVYVDEICEFILNKSNQLQTPVYIHCALGYSRSTLIAASLIKKQSGNNEVISMIKEKRPNIFLPTAYKEFIQGY